MTSTPLDPRKGFRRLPAAGGRNGDRCNQGRRATDRWCGGRRPSGTGQLHDTDRAKLEIGLLRDGVPFRQGELISGMSRSIGAAAIGVVEVAVVERSKDHTLPDT